MARRHKPGTAGSAQGSRAAAGRKGAKVVVIEWPRVLAVAAIMIWLDDAVHGIRRCESARCMANAEWAEHWPAGRIEKCARCHEWSQHIAAALGCHVHSVPIPAPPSISPDATDVFAKLEIDP